MKNRRLLGIALVTLGLSSLIGGLYGHRLEATPQARGKDDLKDSLHLFTKVFRAVEENYADTVDPDRVILHGAIPSMLRTLDPHSSFFDALAFTNLREDQEGKYQGLGMSIAPRNGKTIVIYPFPGSPASRAGLRPGDLIHAIDGQTTEGLTTNEVAERLRGPKGTLVNVKVLREGTPEPLAFTITRAEIPRHSVELAFHLRAKVGFIKLKTFSETTGKEMRKALKELNEDELEGLIFDLRANAGGLLTQAVEVSGLFLEKNQLIVYHKGRNSREKPYRAHRDNSKHDFPMVILVDCYTASAAEIVAGALQDYDRALILGESSFGKGLVQTVYPLSDNTGLALTTARYYTPSGRLIQRNYSNVSLYNYYSNCRNFVPPREEIRFTAGGRRVYGGGGINPDMKVASPEPDSLGRRLLNQNIFLNFGERYLAKHKTVTKEFQITPAVLAEFRSYLASQKVSFTPEEWDRNLEYMKNHIKQQLITVIFGLDEGNRIAIETDPWVRRALELLPAAKRLTNDPRRFAVNLPDEEG